MQMYRSGLTLVTALMLGSSAHAVTNITVWYPWGPPDGQAVVDRANEFNAMQKDIHVNPVLVSGSGIQGTTQGKFLTAVTSGQVPDAVLYWGQDVIPGLQNVGALLPLDSYFTAAGLKPATFNQTALNAMKVDGKTYGIPQMSSDLMLYYNKDMFKAAGLQPPRTMAELDAAAAKLTVYKGKELVRAGFIPWLQQGLPLAYTGIFGGKLVGADGKVNMLNSGTLKALQWEEGYVKKYGAANLTRFISSIGSTTTSSGSDPFLLEKVAMEVNGQWHGNYLKRYKPNLNYGVVPIPYPVGGTPNATWINSNAWLVPKGSKNPEAALKFIAYMSQPEVSAKHADAVYNISPITGASKFQKTLNEPVVKLATRLFTGKVFTSPVTPQILNLQTELNTAFEAVQQGTKTAQAALQTGQQNLDQAAAQGR
ncbi:ABC transporter substrate-binding protein [Deinococcus sonorensis]|uniref:ABC transporter substrate-binding protein n=2 Tax=Deinococcus sonorensis TaxID=309891 RepID=A0AAU7U8A4_9DEIO